MLYKTDVSCMNHECTCIIDHCTDQDNYRFWGTCISCGGTSTIIRSQAKIIVNDEDLERFILEII